MDQHRYWPKCFFRFSDTPGGLFGNAHIRGNQYTTPAQFFNLRLKLLSLLVEIPRHQREIGAAFSKLQGRGRANALGAARDETMFFR